VKRLKTRTLREFVDHEVKRANRDGMTALELMDWAREVRSRAFRHMCYTNGFHSKFNWIRIGCSSKRITR
jgi:hypothetical protein